MENLFTLSSVALGAIPVVIGLVSLAKMSSLPSKLTPYLSVIFGVGLLSLTGISWQEIIAQGVLVGLSASGLFSGVKAIVKNG